MTAAKYIAAAITIGCFLPVVAIASFLFANIHNARGSDRIVVGFLVAVAVVLAVLAPFVYRFVRGRLDQL
jgi:hypothetical protein